MIKEGYYRVTDVLGVYASFNKVNPEVLEAAKVRGTEVHDACDDLIAGVITNLEEHQGYIESFKQWYLGKEFIKKPERFYCDKLMLTGECDAIYICPETRNLVLVDFKTPARESKSWPLQGAAYYYLAKEVGIEIGKVEFVKLDKDGKKPKVFEYNHEENLPIFLKALELHKYFYKPSKDDVLDNE